MWKPTITHPPCTPSTVTTTSMTPSSPPKATPPQSSPLMTRDSPIPLNDMSTNSNGTTMTFTRFLSHPTWTMFCPSSLLLAIGVMMGPLFWMGPFDTIGGETQEALPHSLLEKKLCTTPRPAPPGPPMDMDFWRPDAGGDVERGEGRNLEDYCKQGRGGLRSPSLI